MVKKMFLLILVCAGLCCVARFIKYVDAESFKKDAQTVTRINWPLGTRYLCIIHRSIFAGWAQWVECYLHVPTNCMSQLLDKRFQVYNPVYTNTLAFCLDNGLDSELWSAQRDLFGCPPLATRSYRLLAHQQKIDICLNSNVYYICHLEGPCPYRIVVDSNTGTTLMCLYFKD